MRESGFGREGAREGMLAYLKLPATKGKARKPLPAPSANPGEDVGDPIDRTRKLYIGGAQKRPVLRLKAAPLTASGQNSNSRGK